MVEKTRKPRLIHLWWFAACLFILAGGVSFVSIYNTRQIVERAEANRQQMRETIRYLRSEPEWKLMTDDAGRNYIDSIRIHTPEQLSRIEGLLIDHAARQLTEYSDTLVKESGSLHNTLILWAALLTLLSIIFIFLGFMELRDKFAAIEETRREMDGTLEKVIGQVEHKIRDVHKTLSEVDYTRKDVDAALAHAQNAISNIADKFEDLSVSTIEDIDGKIKIITALKQEIEETGRNSFFNLSVQAAALKLSDAEKLKAFNELHSRVSLDTLLPAPTKHKIQAELHVHIATVLEGQLKLDAAVEHYDKAVALDPNPLTYNRRGAALRKRGDYEKCIDDYNRALDLAPDYVDAYNNRGMYYAFLEDFDKAIADYNKALGIDSDNACALYNRAQAYAKRGEHKRAVGDYSKALKNDPTMLRIYYKRGLSYKSLRMIKEALDDFAKCVELDPKNQTGYKNSAQAEINLIREIDS